MSKLHFIHFHYWPPLGAAGGLAMCWRAGVSCNIEGADKNRIIATISSDPPDRPWIFVGIYGPTSSYENESFSTEIGDFVCNSKLPFILIGDLNGTLKDNECLNYSKTSNIGCYSFDLRRMVRRTGLIDLGYRGTRFTWLKRCLGPPSGPSLKKARLDRALSTVDWRIAWPNAIIQHLHSAVSDHNLILLDTLGGRHCIKPQFKYELVWERDPRAF